jgi:hypothetical protein
MSGGPLADPRVRRAYLGAKAGILLVALALTWPLSKVLGNQAWYAFIVFAAAMAAVTMVVLGLGRGRSRTVEAAAEPENEPEPKADDEALGPDDVMRVPIEDALDLHSFSPRDVPKVVESYLEEALERGMREVRLIHGRGMGVQRTRVQSLLSRHPAVAGFHDAPPDRGGWGATVVYLLPPNRG